MAGNPLAYAAPQPPQPQPLTPTQTPPAYIIQQHNTLEPIATSEGVSTKQWYSIEQEQVSGGRTSYREAGPRFASRQAAQEYVVKSLQGIPNVSGEHADVAAYQRILAGEKGVTPKSGAQLEAEENARIAAEQARLQAGFGGVRTTAMLAPVGVPTPGLPLAAKVQYLERGTGQWASEQQFSKAVEEVGKYTPVNARGEIVQPSPPVKEVPIYPGTMFNRGAEINRELGLGILNEPRYTPIDVSRLPVLAVKPAHIYIEPTKYTLQPVYDVTQKISTKGEEYAEKYVVPMAKYTPPGMLFPEESKALARGISKGIVTIPEFFASGAIGAEYAGREIQAGRGKELSGKLATGAVIVGTGLVSSFKEKPIETTGQFIGQSLVFGGGAKGIKEIKMPKITTERVLKSIPERTFYDPLVGYKSPYVREILEPRITYIQSRIDVTPKLTKIAAIAKASFGDIKVPTSADINIALGRAYVKAFPQNVPKVSYTEAGYPGMLGEIKPEVSAPKGYIGYKTDVFGLGKLKSSYKPDIRGAFGDVFKAEKGYIFSRPDIAKRIGFKLDIKGAFGDVFTGRTPRGYIGYSTDIFGTRALKETAKRAKESVLTTKERVTKPIKSFEQTVSEELKRPVRYFGEYSREIKYKPFPTLKIRKAAGEIKLIKGKTGEPTEVRAIENVDAYLQKIQDRNNAMFERQVKQAASTIKWVKEPPKPKNRITVEKPTELIVTPKEATTVFNIFKGEPKTVSSQLKGGGLKFLTPSERITGVEYKSPEIKVFKLAKKVGKSSTRGRGFKELEQKWEERTKELQKQEVQAQKQIQKQLKKTEEPPKKGGFRSVITPLIYGREGTRTVQITKTEQKEQQRTKEIERQMSKSTQRVEQILASSVSMSELSKQAESMLQTSTQAVRPIEAVSTAQTTKSVQREAQREVQLERQIERQLQTFETPEEKIPRLRTQLDVTEPFFRPKKRKVKRTAKVQKVRAPVLHPLWDVGLLRKSEKGFKIIDLMAKPKKKRGKR